LVAATFFGGNIDETRSFLSEYGYMPEMVAKPPQPPPARHRACALARALRVVGRALQAAQRRTNIRGGFFAGGGVRQHSHPPLPALSPKESAKAFRGYISSKRRYFMVCACIWW
jgi:hypothetical protein